MLLLVAFAEQRHLTGNGVVELFAMRIQMLFACCHPESMPEAGLLPAWSGNCLLLGVQVVGRALRDML
jgi:hypothetical protein